MEKINTQNLSSCDCYSCMNKSKNFINNKNKTNCNFSPALECKERIIFKNQIEPLDKIGYNIINPEAIQNLYANDFYEIECKRDEMNDSCPKKVYTSPDPRLISIYHGGQKLALDRPPLDPNIKLKDIYTDKSNKNYKNIYKDYADIKGGQIMYYIDKSIEDDLFQPVFENASNVTGQIYKDPMGGTYPEYERVPIKNNNVLNTRNRTYEYGLSSINDQNEFREDIIHLQMRPEDRRRYSTRWTGNITYF